MHQSVFTFFPFSGLSFKFLRDASTIKFVKAAHVRHAGSALGMGEWSGRSGPPAGSNNVNRYSVTLGSKACCCRRGHSRKKADNRHQSRRSGRNVIQNSEKIRLSGGMNFGFVAL